MVIVGTLLHNSPDPRACSPVTNSVHNYEWVALRLSASLALQRNADRAPSTTSTSLPTELAANPLGGELFERKSRQAVDLRFGKKLAAK